MAFARPLQPPKRPEIPLSDSFDGDLGLGRGASYHSPPAPSTPLPPAAVDPTSTNDSWPTADLGPEARRKLARWLVGFGLVVFDIDRGPELKQLYPPSSTSFSETVRANIAFSSLPEGDLPSSGSHTYSWRIPIPIAEDKGRDVSKDAEQGDGFLHGFVYFAQEKNDSLRRGYSQRSLVLITRLPSLVGLFSNTLSLLGQMYFKHPDGGLVIESACQAIANWPTLVPGATLELPFLGSVLTVEFPLSHQPQWQSQASFTDQSSNVVLSVIPASSAPTPLSVVLHDTLSFSKIILLWELVILGEPLLVYSKDPRTASEIVIHLRNLIRPVPFASDYRPYFHIHDQDFRSILSPNAVSSKTRSKGTIISTTNPQIISIASSGTGQGWPNLLVMNSANITTKNGSGSSAALGVAGLKTGKRKREISKDKVVEKNVELAFGRGNYISCDALLFQHLTSLTERFLGPLNRYLGTLPSTSFSLLPPSPIQPFHVPSFLRSLAAHGTTLHFRSSKTSHSSSFYNSSVHNFYSAFLESGNFNEWLKVRTEITEKELRKRWIERVERADLRIWGTMQGEGQDLETRNKLGRALEAELEMAESEQMTLEKGKTKSSSFAYLKKLADGQSRVQRLKEQLEVLKALP